MSESLGLLPKYYGPSSWWEHVPVAHWLIAELKPKVVVELGTHYGVSFFSFCEAASSYSRDSFVYAIDTWEGDPQAGFYGDGVYQVVKEHQQANHLQNSRLIRSTFEEAAAHFEAESVDIVHIDGLHTYEAVRKDFETWLPKLRTGGILLFHDWNVREGDFGVWRLWSQIKQDERFSCIELANGHGLGIATFCVKSPEWHKALKECVPALTAKGALLSQIAILKEDLLHKEERLDTAARHAENLEVEALTRSREIEGLVEEIKRLTDLNESLSSELTRIHSNKVYRIINRLLFWHKGAKRMTPSSK